MRRTLVMLVVASIGCGGGGKKGETGPGDEVGDEGGGDEPEDDSAQMCAPETIDGIQKAVDRKRNSSAVRCLTDAIDAGEAKKNESGEVTMEFTVRSDGSAADVNVTKSTLENQTVEACLVSMVEKMTFSPCPTDFTTSYTFAFEAF